LPVDSRLLWLLVLVAPVVGVVAAGAVVDMADTVHVVVDVVVVGSYTAGSVPAVVDDLLVGVVGVAAAVAAADVGFFDTESVVVVALVDSVSVATL
jgi:hypothetical protein